MSHKTASLFSIATGAPTGAGVMSSVVRAAMPPAEAMGAIEANTVINAETGNLFFTTKSISVADLGVSWPIGFVYNSQDKSAWRMKGFDEVGALSGTINTAGSSVVVTRADGAAITYQYDTDQQAYVAIDPDVGLVTLTYQADKTWLHTTPLTGVQKQFDAEGRLVSRADKNGNQTNIVYEDGQTQIELPSGQTITYVNTRENYTIYVGDVATSKPVQTATIDAQGRLVDQSWFTEQDESSFSIQYTYDDNTAFLQSATQADQTSITFAYDAARRVEKVQDGEGRTQTLTYSAGQCVVTNALSQATQYAINDHQLASVTLAQGEQIDFAYDDKTGLIETVTLPDKSTKNFAYNASGLAVKTSAQAPSPSTAQQPVELIRDKNGRVQNRLTYQDATDPTAATYVQRFVYDEKGNVLFEVGEAGQITQHDYDAKGNRTATRRYFFADTDVFQARDDFPFTPDSLTDFLSHQTQDNIQLTTFDYYDNGLLKTSTRTTHDGASPQVTTHTWDVYGNELTSTQTINATTAATTSKTVDAIGRQTTLEKANGDQYTWQYDDANAAVTSTSPSGLAKTVVHDKGGKKAASISTAGAIKRQTQYTRDAAGQLFKTQLPNGQHVYRLYHQNGNLAYEIDPLGFVAAFTYDNNGREQSRTHYATSIDVTTLQPGQTSLKIAPNANDRTSYTIYNALGQLHYSITPADDDRTGSPAWQVVEYRYNDAGEKTQQTTYSTAATQDQVNALVAGTATPQTSDDDRSDYFLHDPTCNARLHQDAKGYITRTYYDGLGREAIRTRSANPAAPNNFDPNTDAEHDATHYTFYDGANKIGEVNAENIVTQYTYDQAGRVQSKRTYYHPAVADPSQATIFEKLLPAVDPEDALEVYTYDALGRLIKTEYSNTNIHTATYDSNSRVLTSTKTDQAGSATREQSHDYDAFNQLKASTNPRKGVMNYAYDDNGLQIAITDELQQTTVFYYDVKGRVVAEIDAEGCVRQYQYNPFGEKTQTRRLINKLTQDQCKALTGGTINASVTALLSSTQSVNDVINNVTFNKCGKVKTQTDGEGYQTNFSYNTFGEQSNKTQQVDQSGATIQHSFTHDKCGNLQSHAVTGTDSQTQLTQDQYAYDMQHKVISHTDANGAQTTYTRDRLGREVLRTNALGESIATSWDAFNRMLSVTDAVKNITRYVYTQLTRSIQKILPTGVSTTTTHNAFDQVASDTDEKGVETQKTYEAGGKLESETVAGVLQHQYQYHLNGACQQHTDANQLVTAYGYDGSGLLTSETNDPTNQQQRITQTFDGAGRAVQQVDESGVVTALSYDRNSNVTQKVVDAGGLKHTTTTTYNGLQQATSTTVTDANTPAPFVKKMEFDVFSRAAGITKDPDGLSIATKKIRNDAGQAIAEVDGEGNMRFLVRDVLGRVNYKINQAGGVIQLFYNTNGLVTQETQYANGIDVSSFQGKPPSGAQVASLIKPDSADVTTHRVYNDDGHMVYKMLGNSLTGFDLDPTGKAVKISRYHTPLDLSTLTDFTQASIDAAKQTSPKDHITYRIHNEQGYCQYHIEVNENGQGHVTEYAYTPLGQVADEWQYELSISLDTVTPTSTPSDIKPLINTSDNDRHTQHLYDDFANERFRLRYTSATTVLVDEYHYDQRNVLSESRRYQTPLNLPAKVSTDSITGAIAGQKLANDEKDLHHVYTYDALRRKTAVKSCPNNAELNFEEHWLLDAINHTLTHTDRLGQAWNYAYDGAGRKVNSITPEVDVNDLVLNDDQTQYQLTPTETTAIETGFTYDKNSRLLTQTYAQGTSKAHTKLIVRDVLGHAVSVSENLPVDDDMATVSSLTDRPDTVKTVTKCYVFDVHGRQIIRPNKASESDIIVYNDINKKAFEVNHQGIVTHYDYNAFQQLIAVTRYATPIALTDDMLENGVSLATVQGLIKTCDADRCVTFDYDRRGKKILQQENKRWMAHSQNGKCELDQAQPTKTWAYNSFKEVLCESTVLSPDGSVTADVVHRHDNIGDEVAMVSPRGHLTVMAYNASKQVVAKDEYINALPDSVDPKTADVSDLVGAIEQSQTQDRHTEAGFNALGYKISATKKAVIVDQIGETPDGLPTVSTQQAKDLVTRYVPDALGRVTETHYPATAAQPGSSEYVAYNALNKKTKVVHTPRVNSVDQDAKTLTPVTLLSYDVYGHAVGTTRYQDSTAAVSGRMIDAEPVVDETNRRTLLLNDPKGRLLLKQDEEGFWRQRAYKVYGLVSRTWKFLTHWTDDNKPTNVLGEQQYTHDSLGQTVASTTNDGEQTYTQLTSFNTFGEWIARKFSSDDKPVTRDLDNTGQCWRSNQHKGVPEINVTDGAGHVVLTLRSGSQDLMQVDEADLASVAAQDIASVQTTVCERDVEGHVARQQLPSFTQPKSLPLHIDITTGPNKAFGQYAMTWKAPALSSTEMKLTLWKPGDEANKQTLTPTIHGNLAGADVSPLDASEYQFEIEYFYKNPQTGVVSDTPYRSGGGTIPLATGNNPQHADGMMIINEGGNKLVIAGKDPGWKGIALVQDGKIISTHAINRITGQAPFVDLSGDFTGHYDVYAFEDWGPANKATSESVDIAWLDISMDPVPYGPPEPGEPIPPNHPWFPYGLSGDPAFTPYITINTHPPSDDNEPIQFIIRSQGMALPPKDFDPPSKHPTELNTVFGGLPNPPLNRPMAIYSSDIPDCVLASFQGFARVACYMQDTNKNDWFIGYMHNPNHPELAPEAGWRGYMVLDQSVSYGLEVGNHGEVLQLKRWLTTHQVADASMMNGVDPSGEAMALKTLPTSIEGLSPVTSIDVISSQVGTTLQCIPIDVTNIQIINHPPTGHNPSNPAFPDPDNLTGWEVDFDVSPSWVKAHGMFQLSTQIADTGQPNTPFCQGFALFGPSQLKILPFAPIGTVDNDGGSRYWRFVTYLEGSPISASLYAFDDVIPVMGDTPPDNLGNEHYTIPDASLLYISLLGVEHISTATFSYFDTTLGDAGDWVSVANVQGTQTGFVVPMNDIDPGQYQYRLKVFYHDGSEIDLSKFLNSQTHIDSEGYVIGQFSTGGNFATYTTTMPAAETITPTRQQETDRFKRVTSRVDALGNAVSHEYRAFSKHPSVTTRPQIDVTDETGHTAPVNPVEKKYVDERDRVIGAQDPCGHLTVHRRNAIGDTLRTLGDDAVFKDQQVNGFSDVEAITSPLPGGKTSTTTQTHNRRGEKVSETDALGNKKSMGYDIDGNQILATDSLGNSTHSHYNFLKKLLMTRLPMGETTSYQYNSHQVVISQVTANPAGDKEVLSWTCDDFGNKKTQTDLGGVTTTYTRNFNQQITEEKGDYTGVEGKPHGVHYVDDQKTTEDVPANHLLHQFNEAGYEICVVDEAMNQTTHYLIAADGQRESEWFEDQDGEMIQGVTKHRNAMGWMDSIDDLRCFMQRLFDANGNIRAVKVSYFNDGEITPIPEQDQWFTYNEANEMVVMKGSLIDGKVQIDKGKGTELGYEAGFRVSEKTLDSSGKAVTKQITYKNNGLIDQAHRSDGQDAQFTYDPNYVRTSYALKQSSLGGWVKVRREEVPAHVEPLLQDDPGEEFVRARQAALEADEPVVVSVDDAAAAAAPSDVVFPVSSVVIPAQAGIQGGSASSVVIPAQAGIQSGSAPAPAITPNRTPTTRSFDSATDDDDTKPHTDIIKVNADGFVCEQIHKDDKNRVTSDDVFSQFTPSGMSMHQENQMPQYDGDIQWIHDSLQQTNNRFMEQVPAQVVAHRTMDQGDGPTFASLTVTQTPNGHTESVQGKLDDSFRYFIVNHEGRIILKRTGVDSGATEFYFYDTEGRVIGRAGDLPPDGPADAQGRPKDINFTMDCLPIGENWPPSLGADSIYALFNGQTFSSIAENVYVDSSFGDLLGFNAGFNASENIPAEMKVKLLILQATINRNWQGDYPIYDADNIIGSLYPKIPIPGYDPQHSEWGDIFALIFAAVAAIVVPEVMGMMFSSLVTTAGFLTTCVEDVIIGTVTGAVADAGDQEIEIGFGNQKKFNFRELDQALEMGALSGLASGLMGVSLIPQSISHLAQVTSAWRALEVDLKVSLLRTAFTEAADHGKVDWRAFVLDVVDAAASAEVGHVMPSALEGGSEADAVADSVLDDLAKDALYHQPLDWENVAVDAAGSSIGTGIGEAIANKMSTAFNEHRLHAEEAALRRTDMLSRANAIAANQEALASQLNSPAQMNGGGFSSPDFFADENDDFASDWGSAAANDADLSGFTNDPFGTTTTTPTAQVHPQTQGARERSRISSTIQIANALDQHIKFETAHVFAQRTSQQAFEDIEARNDSASVRHYENIGLNVAGTGLLFVPGVGEIVDGAALGLAKAAEWLSPLLSRASLFSDTRLATEGASLDAADLGGEAASSTRMNTSSNMYREGEGETGSARGSNFKRFDVIANDVSKSDAREVLRDSDLQLPNEQRLKLLKQLNSGRMDKVTIKLMEDGEVRLSGVRLGAISGFQRMSFGIDAYGNTNKVVQTAFDEAGELVRQAPGGLKNNLYDVKKWNVPTY